jgi:integrase
MANVNLTKVAKLMGHKTLSMTMRYAHLAPDVFDTAVTMLDNRINPVASKVATTDHTACKFTGIQ